MLVRCSTSLLFKVVSTSLGSLLEMQSHRPYARPAESVSKAQEISREFMCILQHEKPQIRKHNCEGYMRL